MSLPYGLLLIFAVTQLGATVFCLKEISQASSRLSRRPLDQMCVYRDLDDFFYNRRENCPPPVLDKNERLEKFKERSSDGSFDRKD